MLSQRELKKFVEAVDGLVLVDISMGKHYRCIVRTPNAKTHLVIMPVSTSDHRAMLNQRALLRRLVKDNQVPVAA